MGGDTTLRDLLRASRGFLNYVKEVCDPVEDEPRYVRLRRAMRAAQKRLAEQKKGASACHK